jgi:N-acetyl-gamma-glutamyl-phosphate reductase
MGTTTTPRATLVAGIAGASGYAGLELQRLLAGHPHLATGVAQARSDGFADLDVDELAACDVAFLALPHGASRALGKSLVAAGTPVVDLGSDFRLGAWTYGLPELARERIAASTAVASPGCYATAAILALAPLAEAGLLDGPVAIDGKSGVSGAGRSPSERTHLPSLHGGVLPYSPTGHRHVAEIEQALADLAAGPVGVTFTPHLLPTSRGLLVTAYARLARPLGQAELDALFAARYAAEPFVRVVAEPAPQRLAGSNACEVAAWSDERTGMAIVCAALDNLVKGAAGQAIQSANLMLGLDERAGLPERGLWP